MANDEKVLDISERAVLLKKAGFSTAVTLIILLLSTPGFYNFFFDTKGEEARIEAIKAQASSEISYALLKAKTENMEKEITALRGDLKETLTFLHTTLLQQAQVNAGAGRGMGRSRIDPSVIAPTMPVIDSVKKSAPLPENLDPLVYTLLKDDLAE